MDRILDSVEKHAVKWIAITIGFFHLLNVAGILTLSTMPIRIIHVLAMLLIVFLTTKTNVKGKRIHRVSGLVIGLLLVFCSVYLLIRWEAIISSGGTTTRTDTAVGLLMLLIVLESTRRSVGLVLAIICTVFLIYPFIGQYLPGILHTRVYSLSRIVSLLFTSTEGIYGIPISVSSNYIVLFCIYGAFLSEFGAGKFLFDLSSVLTRKFSAATAKTSIIFSALIGMISGSAAGNVAITGSLTIPMMVEDGYKPEQAGAVSAVAATGGQIMPPVMGAAAFIMASIIGAPYAEVMRAALVPAILYFLSIFIIVHMIAKKDNIAQVDINKQYKSIGQVLREGWHYALPIIALIIMMIIGYSPFKAALYSIVTLLIVYTINELLRGRLKLKTFVLRILNSVEKGTKDTVPIAAACAAAGIIAGILSVTGLGSKLSTMIVAISGGSLGIALLLTMVISIILGMGLPTTAAYLVLASVVAPALVNMGASLMAAHLFVFYFGCISTITPPVALASYVAAGIAKANLNRVGWIAFTYGIVSFILPYMFVFGSGLLMEGSTLTILQAILFAILGVSAISAAVVGYAGGRLNITKRIVLVISGLLMVAQGTLTDIVGLVLMAIVTIMQYGLKQKEERSV